MTNPRRLSDVRKIAVLRANALGDFVFSLPALAALRTAYPQAEIVLIGRAWHAAFLEGRPGPVDRVLVAPPYRGVTEPDTWAGPDAVGLARIEDFFERAQAEGFDLALQMHGGGGNSNPFVSRLGARFTAGLRARGAPALDRWIRYAYWQHEVLRQMEVARLVGAEPVMIEPRLEVTARDRAEACQAVPETGRPLVVIHPGASDPRRRWPAQRFAAVGDALARQGNRVAVVGIPEEAGVVQAVVGAMHEPALNLCGALSLHALTGLLERAALVLANDSGPRHLAEAVGTATVSVFWCGNLINAGSAFRARHRPHLSWRLECPVCGKNTLHERCPHEESFVDDVPVEDVLASAVDLLETIREG
jgi:ADP-heptose:LPS heptosyltransferase